MKIFNFYCSLKYYYWSIFRSKLGLDQLLRNVEIKNKIRPKCRVWPKHVSLQKYTKNMFIVNYSVAQTFIMQLFLIIKQQLLIIIL